MPDFSRLLDLASNVESGFAGVESFFAAHKDLVATAKAVVEEAQRPKTKDELLAGVKSLLDQLAAL